MALPQVTIYTDGGCRPNPGPGGWGAVILRSGRKKPEELKGGEAGTTNNRMELTAALEALRSLGEPHRVELVTDSEYLRSGITEWLPRWVASGWRTADKRPVKNRDLWEALAAELERHQVAWRWTRGHSGQRWNERADQLATEALPRPPLPVEDAGAVHVFAAAARSGKAEVGGWGVVLRFGDRQRTLSGRVPGASANRMHLQAAVAGLGTLRRAVRVHLYTTSDYLKDGATAWVAGWRARGWTTREGKPVSHRDLWQALSRLAERHQVHWHVAAREDRCEELEEAKRLATAAVKREGEA